MSIFDIHDPPGIKWLYQLEVGLSPLYDYKLKLDISDTRSDKCNVTNSTANLNHFCLHRTRFTENRYTLFTEGRYTLFTEGRYTLFTEGRYTLFTEGRYTLFKSSQF